MLKTTKTILNEIQDLETRDFDDSRDYAMKLMNEARSRQMSPFQKAKVATMLLLDATNTMGSEREVTSGIVAGIVRTHRYLQSQGIISILTALGEFGRSDSGSDPRNEHAKGTCAKLLEVLRDRIYWKDE
jgi:hypothetical protein